MSESDRRKPINHANWRIKFGMLESFILIFLLFVGLGFFFEYNQNLTTTHLQAEKLFLQSARGVQHQLTNTREAVTVILRSAKAYHEAGALSVNNVQSANTLFLSQILQYPFITSINVGDGDGNGYLLLVADQQYRNRVKKAAEEGQVTWLTLGEKGETVHAESVKDDYDPRTRPWYQNSVNRQEIVWSAPYKFRTTGDIGITASLWLGNADGHNEVVGIDIMLKDLSQFLADLTTEKNMEAHLVAEDGTLIASSEVEAYLARLQQEGAALPNVNADSLPLVEKALKARTNRVNLWPFTSAGERFLAIMEPLSFVSNNKLSLMLTVPEQTFSGDFAMRSLLRLGLMLLLLIAASVWYISRYLLPLRRFAGAIKEFGKGEFKDLQIKEARNDEIGVLASNFIEMTKTLGKRDELLRENEERLRQLEDNLPDSYVYRYCYDSDGTIHFLHISAGVESLHGVSREEALRDATTLHRQINAAQRAVLGAAEKVSQQEMSDYTLTISFYRNDGELRWLMLRARPHRRADGQLFWDGVATDTTERQQTEALLLEQTSFTENLIASSASATFVLDAQHKVIIWNKACEELTGFAAETLIGTDDHWQAFYDHQRPCLADIVLDTGFDGLAKHYAIHAKSALLHNGLHAEGWYKQLNGHDRYILFDAAPVYDSTGRLRAAIETLQDITQKKLDDEALRLQSVALQAAASAIVITDHTGSIEWVNRAFEVLTGYSEAEVIGRNPRELINSGAHDKAFYQELWETLLNGQVWRGDITNRHKDGSLYHEGQTITPVKNADGVITHFIAIKRDLTEQRKLEEQLRQSQKMESIGTLAGGIAHDFNNILTAISGYGQLSLMKMAADDPHRYNIESILEAVVRATHLTQQMLLFSRKKSSDKRSADLNEIVTNVEKFLRRIIGEDIDFKTVLHERPIPVLADAHQLEQVLMNLATNARDAIPSGGALTLSTKVVTMSLEFATARNFRSAGPCALITVTDSGTGMDKATLQRIFEPFFTTKEAGKGTGLGLSVVYGIIKEHDGSIDIASEPGAGSTFSIYLPLITEAKVEQSSTEEDAVIGGSETILLAEDDKMVREMTVDLLTAFGYTVITAEDGMDAVRKFTEYSGSIDLLIFDLIMPKMNGKEAFDEICKVHSGIKIIFCSGYAPDALRQKVEFVSGAYLLTKPSPPNTLLRKIRSVLDKIGS